MDCLKNTLEKFRKFFGKEAMVEIIESSDKHIIAKFYGHMCYTCGTYDYFEDFIILYSECAGKDWIIDKIEGFEDYYIVTFKPKKD